MSVNSKLEETSDLLEMTTQIVTAYVSNNKVDAEHLPETIKSVYQSLTAITPLSAKAEPLQLRPAVPVEDSIQDDYIICLEDGKQLKMLKRHLRSTYDLTPEEYRAKWGLSPDYPMVAPNYAKQRSKYAKQIGLGKNKSS